MVRSKELYARRAAACTVLEELLARRQSGALELLHLLDRLTRAGFIQAARPQPG